MKIKKNVKCRRANLLQFLSNQYQCIMEWADSYDLMQQDEKKMVLAHLIERIEVRRGYYITVKFYVALEDFQKKAAEEKIRVEESPTTYFSTAL